MAGSIMLNTVTWSGAKFSSPSVPALLTPSMAPLASGLETLRESAAALMMYIPAITAIQITKIML
ncbi:hypothetical protein [Candidatus Nitrosotenuis uzonensis]|uniref:hypothetical protein n=1 Tax=Candidatus Nitrosotenuis uzonensis TaxID=1407055 RepID=UPI0019612DC4|nr:hypothetical protein [Candidatus Nitrosotenuis uzonensis]